MILLAPALLLALIAYQRVRAEKVQKALTKALGLDDL